MTSAGDDGCRLLSLEILAAGTASGATVGGLAGATSKNGAGATAAVVQIEVEPKGALFAGHFPGRPVLPGIAHLALLRRALAELAVRGDLGGGGEIVAVPSLRLRSPVAPGDRLELRIGISAGGEVRFELRRGGELASQGQVRVSPAAGWHAAAAPGRGDGTGRPGSSVAERYPAVADLLPHGPEARLLAEVVTAGDAGIVCAAEIPADYPLAESGRVAGFMSLEIGAQAAAALQCLRTLENHDPRLSRQAPGRAPETAVDGPRIGLLVGVRDARFPAFLPAGYRFHVRATPAGSAAPLAIYAIELYTAGAGGQGEDAPLATGIVSTYVPGPPQTA